MDINGDSLAEELFKAYLKQVLIDGFFHADPHPGNIFLTDDRRIALLDLGMTGRVGGNMQETLLRLLLAISEGNGDEAVKIVLQISEKTKDFDETEFTKKGNRLCLRATRPNLKPTERWQDLIGGIANRRNWPLCCRPRLKPCWERLYCSSKRSEESYCPTFQIPMLPCAATLLKSRRPGCANHGSPGAIYLDRSWK